MAALKRTSDLVPLFSALADATRMRLLNLMADREVCVCFFVEILGQSQPKISRHLAYLRNASLVQSRREGKWMHYSIKPPTDEAAATIFQSVLENLRTSKQMQVDRRKLDRACCKP